ncbi:hypothetical protein AUC61_10785 [Pseudomonas sp. S25]|uniref:Cyclophilin-like domain-containing protein n=1 Tax=Pseudomonas maioricensis TaxID=1766623 RepID=A0ABS9ZHK3_9PSED|nr:cyclophilin-like fold protein [Pseudomonas sp. S25]MCI8210020.1 hypothetical protein [Pseudomonas sp. S25]
MIRSHGYLLHLRQRAARLVLGLLMLSAEATPVSAIADTKTTATPATGLRIGMTVGDRQFAVTLADNDTARALAARLPLTLNMPDLNGNEKHVTLAQKLPTVPFRPGVIHNGDLMLYGSDTLVLFYLTFDSPYSYTRIGRVEGVEDLAKVLGRSNVRVVFSRQ